MDTYPIIPFPAADAWKVFEDLGERLDAILALHYGEGFRLDTTARLTGIDILEDALIKVYVTSHVNHFDFPLRAMFYTSARRGAFLRRSGQLGVLLLREAGWDGRRFKETFYKAYMTYLHERTAIEAEDALAEG